MFFFMLFQFYSTFIREVTNKQSDLETPVLRTVDVCVCMCVYQSILASLNVGI